MQGYYYLASPHSHEDVKIREFRSHVAAKAVYTAMLGGIAGLNGCLYSPIASFHWAHEAINSEIQPSFSRYAEYDFTMIGNSAGMILLPLSDNFKSTGVQAEIAYCKSLTIPIYILRLNQNFISSHTPHPVELCNFSPESFRALGLEEDPLDQWKVLDKVFSDFLKAPKFQGL